MAFSLNLMGMRATFAVASNHSIARHSDRSEQSHLMGLRVKPAARHCRLAPPIMTGNGLEADELQIRQYEGP